MHPCSRQQRTLLLQALQGWTLEPGVHSGKLHVQRARDLVSLKILPR